MRAVPLTKEQIERAKRDDLYVVQIMISGQYRKSKDGGMGISGAFSEEKAQKLHDFIREWYRDEE